MQHETAWVSTAHRAALARKWLLAAAAVQPLIFVAALSQYAATSGELDAGAGLYEGPVFWIAWIVYVVVLLGSLITFLRWFTLSHRNIRRAGALVARHRPLSTVVAWFVPIWALFGPKKMVNDLWHASDPDQRTVGEGARTHDMPSVFLLWWLLWILVGFIDQASFRQGGDSTGLQVAGVLDMVSAVLTIPLALLAVKVVELITERQEQRRHMLQSQTTDSATSVPTP